MKKYTNIILIAAGILLLACNIVLVSCSLSRFSENEDNTTIDSYFDEYEYYDEDDKLMDEERY